MRIFALVSGTARHPCKGLFAAAKRVRNGALKAWLASGII